MNRAGSEGRARMIAWKSLSSSPRRCAMNRAGSDGRARTVPGTVGSKSAFSGSSGMSVRQSYIDATCCVITS